MNEVIETNTEIIVDGLKTPLIIISQSAMERKEHALQESSKILLVKDAQSQEDAVKAMAVLKSITKGVEASRVLVKKPVLEIGSLIDNTAKNFVGPVLDEISRLSKLISSFQKEEIEKAEKLRREQEAIRAKALKEAEEKRLQLEAQEAAAKTAAQKLDVLQQQEAEEKKLEEAVRQTAQAENSIAPARTAGMVVKKSWKFEVIDIHALFKAKPDLCVITPNNAAIRGMISGGMRECPGLRIYEDISTTVRT